MPLHFSFCAKVAVLNKFALVFSPLPACGASKILGFETKLSGLDQFGDIKREYLS